jgi:SAM-dependent methyltransferase
MRCRHCDAPLDHVFVDLGAAPPSNAFLTRDQLDKPEAYYPLKLFVCRNCFLVQIPEHAKAKDIFIDDYIYYSSVSSTWVAHARAFVEEMTLRLDLGPKSQVIEVASNDGYLLQHVAAKGIPCLGVEPARGPAAAAVARGIPVLSRFFGAALARELAADGLQADLLIANNVLAHVPDINDFVGGCAAALKPGGVATLEFPHLLRLIAESQFDTIYHEHFSYLSLGTAMRIFAANGLSIFDVEELPTHGGSLRIYAKGKDSAPAASQAIVDVLRREVAAGLGRLDGYEGFQSKAEKVKNDFLAFLIQHKRAGRVVVGYAAAAKGNTLLNFAGVKPDLLRFVADASPEKQGRFLPGSRIPVVDEAHLRAAKPDVVVLLAWNLEEELRQQLGYIREWGGQFAVVVPELRIFAD